MMLNAEFVECSVTFSTHLKHEAAKIHFGIFPHKFNPILPIQCGNEAALRTGNRLKDVTFNYSTRD